jgi:adenosylmethionine-8-amino-7-oxononanoate aminotransferase
LDRRHSFDAFPESDRKDRGMTADNIAGVIMESYQGVGPDFAPVEYIQKLRAWCDEHNVVLTFDEVQAGFGRTGKFWAFEHYGVTPDIICCGKGISSGMPISSAVIGREHIMDQFPPGSMTSTHTGNPVCCAAAVANIRKTSKKTSPATPHVSARPARALQGHPGAPSAVFGNVTAPASSPACRPSNPARKIPITISRIASSSCATSAACCSSPPSAPGARP